MFHCAKCNSRSFSLALVVVAILCLHPFGILGADQYDQTSPTTTFRSLGKAIQNNDPKAYCSMIAGTAEIPYDVFVKEIWEGKGGHMPRYGVNSEALANAAPSRVAQFFCDAEILKESIDASEEAEGRLYQVLHLRWSDGKIIRKERFVRVAKQTAWKWMPDAYEHDRPVYDLSSPTTAYLAVGQALRYRLVSELVRTYAISVKGRLSHKEVERLLHDRLSKLSSKERTRTWSVPVLSGLREFIEEEMIPAPAGLEATKCKVWELRDARKGEDRRRVECETFIKEGSEWKWLPKTEYFWCPSKVERKESEP